MNLLSRRHSNCCNIDVDFVIMSFMAFIMHIAAFDGPISMLITVKRNLRHEPVPKVVHMPRNTPPARHQQKDASHRTTGMAICVTVLAHDSCLLLPFNYSALLTAINLPVASLHSFANASACGSVIVVQVHYCMHIALCKTILQQADT